MGEIWFTSENPVMTKWACRANLEVPWRGREERYFFSMHGLRPAKAFSFSPCHARPVGHDQVSGLRWPEGLTAFAFFSSLAVARPDASLRSLFVAGRFFRFFESSHLGFEFRDDLPVDLAVDHVSANRISKSLNCLLQAFSGNRHS